MSDQRFDWENPSVIGRGKEPGHVLALPYDRKKDALKRDTCPYKMTLNGNWKFYWQLGIENVPNHFYETGFDDRLWADMAVPSVWQLQGYGAPYYYASTFPRAISREKARIPAIDHDLQELAIYRRSFEVPLTWDGREVFLHFGAAKSALVVYVNGEFVGYSQGSMTPHEFNVTAFLHSGINQVTAQVFRYSDASYLEGQDMWNLSGIYREVYLYAEPKICLRDFYVKTDLDELYQDAELSVEWELKNYSGQAQEVTVSAWLAGDEEILVGEAKAQVPAEGVRQRFNRHIKQPKKWSAETPNLYTLLLCVKQGRKTLAYKSIRIGFKKVEIAGEKILFNGKPMMIRGTNRHDFDPDHGWAVPKERFYQDLTIMKQNNINAVRTSHYPDDPFFYDLCNEYGFYVMDECDMETHGVRRKGVPGSNPMWTQPVVDRMERMVLRDRNHPCIFMWSLGNEAGDGDNFLRMKEAALKLDATRPFHYEGDFDFTKSDVISRMYPVEETMRQLGNREEIRISWFDNIANALAADSKPIHPEAYKGRPVLLCEYAHAMENSLGNFQEYMDDFEKYDNMCGGFIWDFVDQAIRKSYPDHEEWLYGTDFSDFEPRKPLQLPNTTALTGSNTYFCANGIVAADRTPHPSLYEVKKVYQEIKVEEADPARQCYRVYNKHLFTDLSAFTLRWLLAADGEPMQDGVVEGFHLAPLEQGEVILPYDASKITPDREWVLTVSFCRKQEETWCEAGYEQAWDQFVLQPVPKAKAVPAKGDLTYLHTGPLVDVKGEDFSLTVNQGQITSYRYRGKQYLQSPIRPDYFRALTDNDIDYLNFVPFLIPLHPKYIWEWASRSARAVETKVSKGKNREVKISIRWRVPMMSGVRTGIIVYPDGRVYLRHSGTPRGMDLLRFGTQMALPREFDRVSWYGRGPQETYCDRKTGAKIGRYHSTVSALQSNYMRPQENGNRTDVRWLEVTNAQGEGLRFRAPFDAPLSFSAWHYTQEALKKAEHIHELKEQNLTTLHVDFLQCGVGGDMPGSGCIRDPYNMHPGQEYRYCFVMEPILPEK